MSILWPNFENKMLSTLSVCASYCANDDAPSTPLPTTAARLWSTYKSGGETINLFTSIDPDGDDHGHVHVDVGHGDYFDWLRTAFPYEHVSQSEIKRVISAFLGFPICAHATGEFNVPTDSLPKRGIVTTLLGLQTEASGMQMNITGVDMSVRDDTYSGMRVKIIDESLTEVSIRLRSETTLHVGYLEDFREFVCRGLELLVFETSGKPPNASTRNDPKRRKRASGS